MIKIRRYRTFWFFLLIGSLGILPTSGHTSLTLNGADLLEVCVSRLSTPQIQCLAFISGVTAGHVLSVGTGKTFYCFPENADIAQAKRIIVKYLKKNASLLDKDAAELIFRALANAWPCRD